MSGTLRLRHHSTAGHGLVPAERLRSRLPREASVAPPCLADKARLHGRRAAGSAVAQTVTERRDKHRRLTRLESVMATGCPTLAVVKRRDA